jgi:hypothetical protein
LLHVSTHVQAFFTWLNETLTRRQRNDISEDVRAQLLKEKVLQIPIDRHIVRPLFACFKALFESVNRAKGRLRQLPSGIEITDFELSGMDYVWRLALACPSEQIAADAALMIIDMNYSSLTSKLKVGSFVQPTIAYSCSYCRRMRPAVMRVS